MQEDTFPAAEKILSDIENVVKKDASLKSFEIIPAEDNENKSPVFHQEECLGLASWCVKPLYCYAYRRLLELRQNKHRREEPTTVARWLLGALLLNPDVSTFWNMRRELVRSRKLEATKELSFARLVLYHKPRCCEAFAYRRWLLPYVLDSKEKDYDPPPAESPLCAEIDIASTCADRYANNYHAWSHRRYVMTLRESRGYAHPTLDSEWRSSSVWCQQHVSDYSGHAYRQFLLRKCVLELKSNVGEDLIRYTDTGDYRQQCDSVLAYVKSDSKALENLSDSKELSKYRTVTDFLDSIHGATVRSTAVRSVDPCACLRALSYWIKECTINEDCIRMYNDHETLWYQRRFLAHILVRLIDSYKKNAFYKAEIIDARPGIRPLEFLGVDGKSSALDGALDKLRGPLVNAFVDRSREIVELGKKRDNHEKILVERFVRFVADMSLDI